MGKKADREQLCGDPLNRGEGEQKIAVSWHEIGLRPDAEPTVRDIWARKGLGSVKGTFSSSVPSHDVVLIRVTP